MTGFTYGAAVGGEHAGHDMAAMTTARSSTNDRAEVAALVNRFHTALEQGDSLSAIELLMPDAEILESGSTETVADYRSHHLPADIAAARALTSMRTPPRITVHGDVATSASTSVTKGQLGDRVVDSVGAELIVATHTDQGWRISAIHWSSRRRN
jgi:ketosteroid isomerase-like protein